MRRRSDERGWVTIWGLGLAVMLVIFGGMVVDVWRVFAERQELAGLADSAAIAGATAIDADAFRDAGVVQLDEGLAINRAAQYLAANADNLSGDFTPVIQVVGAPPDDGLEVTLTKDFEFTVLRAVLNEDTLTFSITAFAQPGERVGP